VAEAAGDDEMLGIVSHHLGGLALARSRPEEALPKLRQALAAFQRARDERGQMQVLSLLGDVEMLRGNLEAALAWYDRVLELTAQVENLGLRSVTYSDRARVFSQQAEAERDPLRARQLLEQAITDERAALALEERLGRAASAATAHHNLADRLRRVGSLDEAEEHARQALAVWEQLRDENTWKTLKILEEIAEARGDEAAAAQWRRRKEAARSEAEDRSGDPALPPEFVSTLLGVAAQARKTGASLEQALAADGAPAGFLAVLTQRASWLVAHLQALASGAARPAGDVPAPYRALIEQAWQQMQGK
jgi:tetratricopeptide (TPR) repeat protein